MLLPYLPGAHAAVRRAESADIFPQNYSRPKTRFNL